MSPLLHVLVTLLVFSVHSECSSLGSSSGSQPLTIVTISPSSPTVFYSNHPLQINCSFQISTPFTVTWRRDGQVITGETMETTPNGAQLIVASVPESWDGSCLSCEVDNDGLTGSASVNISVVSPEPVILVHPANITVEKGANFSLSCVAQGFPPLQYFWFKDDDFFLTDGRDGGVLRFTDIDDEDTGVYNCYVRNTVSNTDLMAESYDALVTVRFAAELVVSPDDVTVLNNSIAILECNARGEPPPIITWIKSGRPMFLDDDRIMIAENGSLIITSVILNDTGMYRCRAENELGGVDSDNAMLTVDVPPYLVTTPDLMNGVNISRPLTLECVAFAIPAPDYTWYRFDTDTNTIIAEVQETDRVYMIENGTLFIESTQRSDIGDYICVASNIHGTIQSDPVMISVYAPPLPPENVRLLHSGSSWLQILWNDSPNATPPVASFILSYRLVFETVWSTVPDLVPMIYNISGLYPSAEYRVRVSGESSFGIGDPSEELEVVTQPGVPLSTLRDGPENITLTATGSTNLTVEWAIPHELLMTSYTLTKVVLFHPDGQQTETNTAENTTVLLTDLIPASLYHVDIMLVFVGPHMGPRTRRSVTTLDDVPSDAPTLVVDDTSPTTISLSWSPPMTPNGALLIYTLSYTPLYDSELMMEIVVSGNDTAIVLGDLRPFTNYSLSISANTSAGEGPSDTVVAMTTEDFPPPPDILSLVPLNSTALLLSWELLEDDEVPGILHHYQVRYNQLHHGGHPNNITVLPDRSSLVISGLIPYVTYRAMVAGETGAGLGNYSNHIDERTYGDVPTAVVATVTLSLECPSSVLVQWNAPDVRALHGPLEEVHYNISYNDRSEMISYLSQQETVVTSHTLANLDPFTEYSVTVAVTNTNGTAPASEMTTITSCDGMAEPPMLLYVDTINSTAIELSWQPVNETSVPGVLVGYVISYQSREDDSIITNVSSQSSSAILDGLTPFTLYSIRIASRTRHQIGEFGVTMETMTYSDFPAAVPRDVSVMEECPSNLLVNWSQPDETLLYGPVDDAQYVITYSRAGGEAEGHVTVDWVEGQDSYSRSLDGLDVATNYLVVVSVRNINGSGPTSEPLTQTTPTEGVSSPPGDVTATANGSYALSVAWQPPATPNGNPHYVIYYIITSDNSLSRDQWNNVTSDPGVTSVTLSSLTVFTSYDVEVIAVTSCGQSEPSRGQGVTGELPPSVPVGVVISAVFPERLTVQWRSPVSPNGNITHYNVTCPGKDMMSVPSNRLSHECSGLLPDTQYNIAVSAINGAGQSLKVTVQATTSCKDSTPMLLIGNTVTVTLDETKNCTTMTLYILVVVQEVPSSRNITSYTLNELQEKTNEYANERRSKRQSPSSERVYIAGNITDQDISNGFELGDGKEYGGYMNHPLNPGVYYNVGLVGAVDGSETPLFNVVEDSFTGAPTKATPSTATPTTPTSVLDTTVIIIIAAIAGVLVLAICMAGLISCCCCRWARNTGKLEISGDGLHRGSSFRLQRGGSFRLSTKKKNVDPVEEFRANHRTEALEDHPPVPVYGFVNKLHVMRTNDNQLFLEEFASIEMNPQTKTDAGNILDNRLKNRYNNILPYDSTRVKLSSKGHSSDYINANYCAGYRKQKAYIATQGPIPETVSDFWRMVWEQEARTIVMLTNTQERGKTKCEMYWPRDIGSGAEHGNIEVTLQDMTQLADYTIRVFSLLKSGSSKEAREVRQFHFTSWPDHGVPQYATAMLSLIRRVRAYHTTDAGPMVVHCSAGVGRTGTFIVIDSMLEKLRSGEELLDIYGHVSLLRQQRNYMVQTDDQYFFIYEAISEALLCGNTEVPLDHLPGYVNELCNVIPDDDMDTTHIELQFKRLALDRNDPLRFVTASKDANKSKNRYVNVLPYEVNRVCLEYTRAMDGSDYINASHIDSYHIRRAFIATQGPLVSTIVDFWRMVWQYNSPVIVMLTEPVEKGTERSAQYWPEEVMLSQQYGKVAVEMTVERHSGTYTYRDFNLTNMETDQSRCVRHFHYHCWPEVGVPASPKQLIDFLREVQKFYSTLSTKTPIIVHCSNGVGRTGVFIALHILLDRLSVEGMVDVFQTVKNLRIQRPAMVQTLGQYNFCYDAVVDYLQSSDILYNYRQQKAAANSSSDHQKKKRNSSPSRSPARSSSIRNTPARNESFKGSARNLEIGNGGSHIYGGSDGTSTFGTHQSSSAPGTNSYTAYTGGSQGQINTGPYYYDGVDYSLGNGQGTLTSTVSGASGHYSHLAPAATPTSQHTHQLAESQRYSTASTNVSSLNGEQ